MYTSIDSATDLLDSIPDLSKTALTKEIASVVRFSQGGKRAAWKFEKRPNWWLDGYEVKVGDSKLSVPAFKSAKDLKTDGIKAALALFCISRIHFEQYVRDSADGSTISESSDGNNPFHPEHYGSAEDPDNDDDAMVDDKPGGEIDDGTPKAESEDEEEVQDFSNDSDEEAGEELVDEEAGEELVDEEAGEELVDEEAGEELVDEEEAEHPLESSKDKVSNEENSDAEGKSSRFDIEVLEQEVVVLKKGDPEKMYKVMRTKLEELMDEEVSCNEWTAEREDFKLMLGLFTCIAKLTAESAMLRKSMKKKDDEFDAAHEQCKEELSVIEDMVMKIRAGNDEAMEEEPVADVTKQKLEIESDVPEKEAETVEKPRSRRPRRAAPEAAFETPAPLSDRNKRATAAGHALRAGTPSRQARDDEVLYDANGNQVDVLFSSKGSPIFVTQSNATSKGGQRGRRGRRAGQLPPVTPSEASTASTVRRSKRNKP